MCLDTQVGCTATTYNQHSSTEAIYVKHKGGFVQRTRPPNLPDTALRGCYLPRRVAPADMQDGLTKRLYALREALAFFTYRAGTNTAFEPFLLMDTKSTVFLRRCDSGKQKSDDECENVAHVLLPCGWISSLASCRIEQNP